MANITRRKFLRLGACAVPGAIGLDASCLEPTSLRVTKFNLSAQLGCRLVHFTDFHYKGNARYAAEVVRTINDLKPDFVCFTGDLVEDKRFATEALGFIRQMEAPVYGSPGNHDYRCGAPFAEYERAFAATGGAWLADQSLVLPSRDLEITGTGTESHRLMPAPKAKHQILLMHYPANADRLQGRRFDLILAGHSHGGQVRLPFYGALILPWGVGRYEHGHYDTPAGALYVNAGIGTYHVPLRFNCRPEITLVTM